jgi:hypothetical protein
LGRRRGEPGRTSALLNRITVKGRCPALLCSRWAGGK